MVTREEYVAGLHEVFDPIGRDITEVKTRLRGADTGPGQRHEHFDMLQGIDGDAHDTQYRVRGPADRGWDQFQDIQATVNGIAAKLDAHADEAATDAPEALTAKADDAVPSNSA